MLSICPHVCKVPKADMQVPLLDGAHHRSKIPLRRLVTKLS